MMISVSLSKRFKKMVSFYFQSVSSQSFCVSTRLFRPFYRAQRHTAQPSSSASRFNFRYSLLSAGVRAARSILTDIDTSTGTKVAWPPQTQFSFWKKWLITDFQNSDFLSRFPNMESQSGAAIVFFSSILYPTKLGYHWFFFFFLQSLFFLLNISHTYFSSCFPPLFFSRPKLTRRSIHVCLFFSRQSSFSFFFFLHFSPLSRILVPFRMCPRIFVY